MIKEFSDNVQRLFDESVQDKSVQSNQTSVDLLAVLHRKVTQPIQVITDSTCTCAIYYNVSVTVKNDLSSMSIAYNSDYQMTFHHLSSCNLHQLSEFILALEHDIPKWRHIWVADNKLRQEKAKIGERFESAMRQFRYAWMSVWACDDKQMVERFRIKYYNLQACKMCLDNDNPFWEDKKTEAEILEECRILHMNPPMEQWYTDFTDFIDECKQTRDERDRKREEQQREQEKRRHLARIKQLKLEAFINAIEFHNNFSVRVDAKFRHNLIRYLSRPPKDDFFFIIFSINNASTTYRVYIKDVDRYTPAIISAINCINDMIPDLQNALVNDGQQYYLMDEGRFIEQTMADVCKPFTVVEYSRHDNRVTPHPHLSASRVVNRINTVIKKLEATIAFS